MNRTSRRARPRTERIQLDYSDVAALGAVTSGDITLLSLPVKSVIMDVFMVVETAFVGTSISALTASVGKTTAEFEDAVTDGSILATGVFGDATGERGTTITNALQSVSAAVDLKVHFAATGANLSALTAGKLSVYVVVHELP
jgi:hypothetical protein